MKSNLQIFSAMKFWIDRADKASDLTALLGYSLRAKMFFDIMSSPPDNRRLSGGCISCLTASYSSPFSSAFRWPRRISANYIMLISEYKPVHPDRGYINPLAPPVKNQ